MSRRYDILVIGSVCAMVLASVILISSYTYHTISQIRAGLPQEVLDHQQAIFLMQDDFARLLHDANTAVLTSETPVAESMLSQIKATQADLETIRSNYSFDFLYGAAALHAIVNPALEDVKTWLQQGIYQYDPESSVARELVFLRIQDAYQQIHGLLSESYILTRQAVANERAQLDNFRSSAIWASILFIALLLASLVLYWQLRKTSAQVIRLQQQLAEAIENMPEGIALFNHQNHLLVSNQRFREFFELDQAAQELAHNRMGIFRHCLHNEIFEAIDDQTETHELERILLTQDTHQALEIKLCDGRHIQLNEHLTQRHGRLAIATDITPFKQTQSRLEYMANHDALTDLPTRRLLQERLETALQRIRRNQDSLALMFIDLDHFKEINDTYGHAVGDVLLQRAARRLRGCFRTRDTIARIGGDEFVILLEGHNNPKLLTQFAERILDTLQHLTVEGIAKPLDIEVSIGISLAENSNESADQLLYQADSACYRAKAAGRNNYAFYQLEHDELLANAQRAQSNDS